jgi:MYXO-CTERM domain-containing protein
MNKAIASMLVVASISATVWNARADQEAADESYFEGPGGGEVASDGGDGTPPLESTGLEDGIGGSCDCSVTGQSATPLAGLVWLVAGSAVVARRRQRRVVGG